MIALLNPGSVRAPVAPVDGDAVTYGALFRAEPFGHNLVTMTLSGAQLKAVLEQQGSPTRQSPMILQVSDGFTYAFDPSRPLESRVLANTMRLHGQPIRPDADYRVTINSFMASGGDGFTRFGVGRDKLTGMIDVDAAELYFAARSPVTAPVAPRVGRVAIP